MFILKSIFGMLWEYFTGKDKKGTGGHSFKIVFVIMAVSITLNVYLIDRYTSYYNAFTGLNVKYSYMLTRNVELEQNVDVLVNHLISTEKLPKRSISVCVPPDGPIPSRDTDAFKPLPYLKTPTK